MELQRFTTLALSNTMANGLEADSMGQLNISEIEQTASQSLWPYGILVTVGAVLNRKRERQRKV